MNDPILLHRSLHIGSTTGDRSRVDVETPLRAAGFLWLTVWYDRVIGAAPGKAITDDTLVLEQGKDPGQDSQESDTGTISSQASNRAFRNKIRDSVPRLSLIGLASGEPVLAVMETITVATIRFALQVQATKSTAAGRAATIGRAGSVPAPTTAIRIVVQLKRCS